MSNEVRIALLSVDHEDLEGYTKALKNVFEEHVISAERFEWGAPVLQPGESDRYRRISHDEDDHQLRLRIPESAAVAVSMFMEQVSNTISGRDDSDRDRRKTWTLALYEVVPAGKASATIGRIKLMDGVSFTRSAVGFGQILHPLASSRWELDHGQDEQGKFASLTINGCSLVPNEKTRSALAEHARTSSPKPVKASATAAK
jgi:hypothetical protein